jgi:AcrR family transcriptional regulator
MSWCGWNLAVSGENNKYNLRQEKILTYSAKVIAQEGYEKASIRRIAKEMGMSISALYYYFSSKEELLFSIQHTSFADLLKKLEARLEGVEAPDQRLFILIENHIEHFLNRLNELTICSHEINTLQGAAYEKVLELRRRYYDTALAVIDGIQKQNKRSALDTPLATLNLFGMLNWIYMWFDPAKNRSHRVVAEELYNLFLNGINSTSRSGPCDKGATA